MPRYLCIFMWILKTFFSFIINMINISLLLSHIGVLKSNTLLINLPFFNEKIFFLSPILFPCCAFWFESRFCWWNSVMLLTINVLRQLLNIESDGFLYYPTNISSVTSSNAYFHKWGIAIWDINWSFFRLPSSKSSVILDFEFQNQTV